MSFEESQFRSHGIRAARLGGVEVWIHWSLLVLWALSLAGNYMGKPPMAFPLSDWITGATSLFLAILLHELGHAFMAIRIGGRADHVILYPLGGLAWCDTPPEPRAELLVAAAGPAVNVLLALAATLTCTIAGWSVLPEYGPVESYPYVAAFLQHMVVWNVFLLIINLLPCLPLDGGRIARAVIWSRLESHVQATLLTLRMGQAFAVVGLISGLLILFFMASSQQTFSREHPILSPLGWGLIMVAGLHFVNAKRLQRQALDGDDEESGIFGYDFSGGYTSLERTAARRSRPGLFASLRSHLKERARAHGEEEENRIRERLDELLAKIHAQGGMDALTAEEKRFLKRASKILRR